MINLSLNLAAAARRRIQETKPQRLKSLQAIAEGRPLDAEPDGARKIRRLQTVMRMGPAQAEAFSKTAIAPNQVPTKRSIGGREVVQGDTTDFLDVAFLETAVAAAGTVARVAFANRRPHGSGFMVSNRLFLTNNHVISSPSSARQFVLEFDYQLDFRAQPRVATRYDLDPDVFFLTSPEDELDFTLIAVGRRLDGQGELDRYGFCPLLARQDKHVLGELVNVVQHPEGNFKQAVIRENQLVARLATVLHYVADTNPGSSGSPVFNDQWEAVALHHWGEPYTETIGSDGRPVRYDVNEGIRVSAILRKLEAMRPGLDANERRALLDAVLEPSAQYPTALDRIISPEVSRPSEEAAGGFTPGAARILEDGSAVWSVPLQVAVNLGRFGAPAPAPRAATPAAPLVAGPTPESGGEKVEIDREYNNRQGYNPKFLAGHIVQLPSLTKDQKDAGAKLKEPKADENPFELKYTHFSIVVNAKRRLAFFTACNIDGRNWINIDRDTGLPKEAAEASETWYDDPRIGDTAQSEQSLYDKQTPKRVFDRGHLVRRQDPTWGTEKRAIRANADTFHFANCTPQASTFNQSAKFWQGIEQYLLEDNAVADMDRISVFTGPVFDDDDRPYRYVKVPRQYWKIIVRLQDGELAVIALLADQSEFIKKLPESFAGGDGEAMETMEAWDDTTKVEEFISTVEEIERLTGLDFGELRDHDSNSGGGEAMKRPLTSFKEIPLKRSAKQRRPARQARSSGKAEK